MKSDCTLFFRKARLSGLRECTRQAEMLHPVEEEEKVMTQEIITLIQETVGTEIFGIWFLIGAAFVFFMQAGFAMVETGFTRAKNAGNIIMKNLMDFCIGTCVFIPLGYGLLLGEDSFGGGSYLEGCRTTIPRRCSA